MKVLTGKQFETTIYFVSKGEPLDFLSEKLSNYASETLGFKGKAGEKVLHLGPNTENVLIIGLGDSKLLTRDHYVKAAHLAAQLIEENKISQANMQITAYGEIDETLALQGTVEGVLQAAYTFQNYKTEKVEQVFTQVSFITDISDADKKIDEVVHVVEGINLTRDLVNTPANDLYPETLVDEVKKAFMDTAVEIEVLDKEDLINLGAKALLAVSQGSAKEPRMIVLKYLPLGENEPVVSLVGKGVTYDSGGYALKTAKGMATMMTDMAGAASMIGTLKALEANNIQQNVVAIIGATENLISGEAFKNGDIIDSLKGTTIEVLNTDAEGRLVLADILYYAATKLNSKYIIDAATLTGAVIAALGQNITGVLTNNQELLKKVIEASKLVGEDMWELPILDEFKEAVKGNNADLTNSQPSPTGAGTIFAAAFLEHFVENIPWVHLDIAGTSYASGKGNKYLPKGASGIPVKTLYEFVKNL